VVIQAGGPGRRLAPVNGGLPKALTPFAGGTLLSYQLDRLEALAPERRVVIACHGAAAVQAAAAGRAEVLTEPAPLGTAGGLALLPEGPEVWLVINVDHVSDVDLEALVAAYRPAAVAALSRVEVPVDEGVVALERGQIIAYRERPVLELPVTTGLYVFQAAALRRALDRQRCEMPALVRRLMGEGVHAYEHPGYWIDAGTPERLAAARAIAR
jgi:NDP-sugar pyrophosphorylase family protein